MVERVRKPAAPISPLQHTLASMAARMPDVDEVAAIKALLRGHADPGQQLRAMAYVLTELCGVGTIPFTGEHTQGTAFRCGSLGVGIALTQIGDGVVLRFPTHSEGVHGEGETPPI